MCLGGCTSSDAGDIRSCTYPDSTLILVRTPPIVSSAWLPTISAADKMTTTSSAKYTAVVLLRSLVPPFGSSPNPLINHLVGSHHVRSGGVEAGRMIPRCTLSDDAVIVVTYISAEGAVLAVQSSTGKTTKRITRRRSQHKEGPERHDQRSVVVAGERDIFFLPTIYYVFGRNRRRP